MIEDGAVIVDGRQVSSTAMCVHCGMHFEMVRGSGKIRGWCMKCGGITCGQPDCDRCIPLEARLDYAEGTKSSMTETIRQLIAEGASII